MKDNEFNFQSFNGTTRTNRSRMKGVKQIKKKKNINKH